MTTLLRMGRWRNRVGTAMTALPASLLLAGAAPLVPACGAPSESALVADAGATPEAGSSVDAPAAPDEVVAACDLGLRLDAAGCAAVHAMAHPATLPPAVGNRVADDANAADLGYQLFFDMRLSSAGTHACGTCHEPVLGFADGRRRPRAPLPVARNTPSVLDAPWKRWFFWDGRADTLWGQATVPIENPAEMNMSRLAVAKLLDRSYRAPYEAVFGPLPDVSAWPAAGKPGDAAYDGMTAADRLAVDTILANVGKALEAYERKLVTEPAPLDRFLSGERDALTASQIEGLELFVSSGCARCHAGSTLTDGAFHNVGTSEDTPDGRGRSGVYDFVRTNPFGAHGPFFDGDPSTAPTLQTSDDDVGALRTPPLRSVTLTAPYGHDGRWLTLTAAVQEHPAAVSAQVGRLAPGWTPITFDATRAARVVDFLRALEGGLPPIRWSRWPSG
jgi:cytochrome c peroxidase